MLVDRIGPLVEPLHEAFEAARYRLDTAFPGLIGPDQDWLRTHTLRGLLYQDLNRTGLSEGWTLGGGHNKNGAVHLVYGSAEIAVRVVHKVFGDTPPAGSNRLRRAFYTNAAIRELSDEKDLPVQNLLATWAENGADEPFEIDVVRPIEPGRVGKGVRADLAFPLPRNRTAFEDLEFDTRDEDETLNFSWDDEDQKDGDG